jgi:hypothetical protein
MPFLTARRHCASELNRAASLRRVIEPAISGILKRKGFPIKLSPLLAGFLNSPVFGRWAFCIAKMRRFLLPRFA